MPKKKAATIPYRKGHHGRTFEKAGGDRKQRMGSKFEQKLKSTAKTAITPKQASGEIE